MPDVAEPVLAGDNGTRAAVGVSQGRCQLADGARGAAAHVVGAQGARPAGDARFRDRRYRDCGSGGDIAYVHEVAPLGPVLEDPRRAAGRERGTEERRQLPGRPDSVVAGVT